MNLSIRPLRSVAALAIAALIVGYAGVRSPSAQAANGRGNISVPMLSAAVSASSGTISASTTIGEPNFASREVPRSSASFVDSVGVVVHYPYADSPYHRYPQRYTDLIKALHIRNIRANGNTNSLPYFDQLCASGVHHTVSFNVGVNEAIVRQQIGMYGANCIDAVEPSNEYDAYGLNPKHPDPNWVRTIINEQKTLYRIMKSNPAWRNITVLGPSLASAARWPLLGNLEAISDAGNQHDGTCDGNPLTKQYKNIVHNLALVRVSYPTKPIWTGETNYANDPRTSRCAVSKEVAAKYVPRMFLDRYNLGIPHTFLYELSDDAAEGPGWGTLGLTDNQANAWPAYRSLQSLLAILPSASSASLVPLSYSVSGSTADVDHALLQSSDGTYFMLLWIEVPSWNVKTKRDIQVSPQRIEMTLPSRYRSATYYTANSEYGLDKAMVHGNRLTLTVSDSPSVLQLR